MKIIRSSLNCQTQASKLNRFSAVKSTTISGLLLKSEMTNSKHLEQDKKKIWSATTVQKKVKAFIHLLLKTAFISLSYIHKEDLRLVLIRIKIYGSGEIISVSQKKTGKPCMEGLNMKEVVTQLLFTGSKKSKWNVLTLDVVALSQLSKLSTRMARANCMSSAMVMKAISSIMAEKKS